MASNWKRLGWRVACTLLFVGAYALVYFTVMPPKSAGFSHHLWHVCTVMGLGLIFMRLLDKEPK